MDEPCSSLDPISTMAIEDLISELKQQYTIVIVTHNMQQAARVSDQTAFFNLEAVGKPGRLVEIASTEKIFSTRTRRPPRTTSPGASARPDALDGQAGVTAGGCLLGLGKGAGRLEDHASCHFHGVVGKALVESAQQRHVDGGRHSVLPFAVHQHGEQMPVQVVHRVVFFADLGGLFRVVRQRPLGHCCPIRLQLFPFRQNNR